MSALKRRAFSSSRTAGLAGVLLSATLFTTLPSSADPAGSPGHAIANRFAEDANRAEVQRKEAAQKLAQQRKEQAAKAAKEKAQKAHEAEMIARARAEADERRKLEEDAARLDAIRAEREAREAEAERQRAEKTRLIEAARETEQARVAEEARKAEEMKRAAEALRLAAEKTAAEEARKAQEARKAEETARLAEAERRAEDARKAEQAAWAAEEAKRLAEARKAEDARKADEIRKAEEAKRIAAEAAARADDERRAAEASRAIQRATSDDARRVADMEADAEIARVAESLRRIREEHLARRTGPAVAPVTATIPERKHEPSSGQGVVTDNQGFRDVPLAPPRSRAGSESPERLSPEPKLAYDGHVTVVLQMEPRYRRGRRYESMDPVLCTAGGCYVSNGAEQPATFLDGNRAVRFGNAIGRRAGACNHATTCVFRSVDLGALPADVQPVDIRVIRHDRREPERVEALSSCRSSNSGRMACTGAIHGDGYTMWVISESTAERLALDAFDGALDGGSMDSAEVDPKLNPWRHR